jgi:hypothetical protein
MSKEKSTNPFMGEKLEKFVRGVMMERYQQQPVTPYVLYEFNAPTSADITDPNNIGPLMTWAAMTYDLEKTEAAIKLLIRPDVVKESLLEVLQEMVKLIELNYDNVQMAVLTHVMKADVEINNAH